MDRNLVLSLCNPFRSGASARFLIALTALGQGLLRLLGAPILNRTFIDQEVYGGLLLVAGLTLLLTHQQPRYWIWGRMAAVVLATTYTVLAIEIAGQIATASLAYGFFVIFLLAEISRGKYSK